jgi:hypothetical protein
VDVDSESDLGTTSDSSSRVVSDADVGAVADSASGGVLDAGAAWPFGLALVLDLAASDSEVGVVLGVVSEPDVRTALLALPLAGVCVVASSFDVGSIVTFHICEIPGSRRRKGTDAM